MPFISGETMYPETIAGHPDRLEKIVAAVRTYDDRARFDNEILGPPAVGAGCRAGSSERRARYLVVLSWVTMDRR